MPRFLEDIWFCATRHSVSRIRSIQTECSWRKKGTCRYIFSSQACSVFPWSQRTVWQRQLGKVNAFGISCINVTSHMCVWLRTCIRCYQLKTYRANLEDKGLRLKSILPKGLYRSWGKWTCETVEFPRTNTGREIKIKKFSLSLCSSIRPLTDMYLVPISYSCEYFKGYNWISKQLQKYWKINLAVRNKRDST